MHSKAFRSFSSVMASRSTAPAHKNICQLYIMFSEENSQIIWLNSQTEEYEAYYTLVCAVVKHIEGLHSCRTPLLVTKDQIDPIMKVRWHVLRLLKNRIECWNCLVLSFLHYLLAWWLHQGFAVLIDEVLRWLGPFGKNNIIYSVLGHLQAT